MSYILGLINNIQYLTECTSFRKLMNSKRHFKYILRNCSVIFCIPLRNMFSDKSNNELFKRNPISNSLQGLDNFVTDH